MIALDLQEKLKDELKETILKGVLFKSSSGDDKEIEVFKQSLPEIGRSEDEDSLFPYIIIRLDSGKMSTEDNSVRVLLLFGIYDDDKESQGHVSIMNCIDKIYLRFSQNSVLANMYRASSDMEWQLQEDDTKPYYFGGMEMRFELETCKQEDEYT